MHSSLIRNKSYKGSKKSLRIIINYEKEIYKGKLLRMFNGINEWNEIGLLEKNGET